MAQALSTMPDSCAAAWRAAGLWRDVSLGEAMALAASTLPQAPLHLVDAEGREQVRDLAMLHAEGLRLAGSLHALGIRAGDTIAMQLPNSLTNAVVFQAAAALGCTLLPIIHIYGPHELAHILRDSGAKALLVPDAWRSIDYLERLARLPELPALQHRIIVGERVPQGMLAYDALPQGTRPALTVDPGDCTLLLYTSGTTAAPKGVRHTSRSLLAELVAQSGDDPGVDCVLSPWPSGHIAGTLGLLGHALLGRQTVILEAWNPGLAAELVDRFKVRQMSGTPFHLSGLMEAAARDGRDIASVRQFIIGATTVPPAVVAASEAAGIRCCRCYGSTELPTVSQCDPDDPLDKRLNTDGRPNAGVEVRIVDDFGHCLSVGTEGEVAVRGPERFAGYTDTALDAVSFLDGGWFLTGDIGKLDAEGFLAITDRKKDIIIRGGENVSSREVEELLLSVPGVREAAAIGAPDARLGERICAVVTLDGSAEVTIGSIDAAFRAIGVARQKTPELLVVIEDFPRTPSGKVQKTELRRSLAAEGRLISP
ncbi:AMP-binding protein [Novosphingobium sp. KCTC 2891]|uniref:AMP-binding protein n=1 Tax=unclassified Novosphingobium TaxID=2644732 RepID=UPI002223BBC5|nr:AMP-binding protein [Novosphingobium sp. KCTC 2891]MCW1384756.1 AMP-binding protein [Novosphingobium sp. KCTC 2891]